jgi:hypothetical protein
MPDYQFKGFSSPRYTPTPDELFDELLAPGVLTEAELRVLLYIVRRTFGWKKEADAISLRQLSEGIVRRDGTRLDYGAGVGRAAASRASKSLEAKGIIRAARSAPIEGQDTEITVYSLVMAEGEYPKDTRGVSQRSQDGIAKIPPGVSQSYPQETTVQESTQEVGQLPPSAEAIVEQWQRTSSLLRGMGR